MQSKAGIQKLAVVGSRDYENYEYLRDTVASFPEVTQIISGGARGADTLAERAAEELGLTLEVHPADWKRYGRGAGPIRNSAIIKSAEAVLAFITPGSRGTLDTLRKAKKSGMPVWVVVVSERGVVSFEGEWDIYQKSC